MTRITSPTKTHRATAVRWFLPVLFFLIALSVYFNAISTPFVFDDLESIVSNKSLKVFSWREVWRQQRGFGFWTLSWNRAISGLNPPSYHFTNILIHTVAALCLSGIVRRTLTHDLFDERLKRDAEWLAWLSGVIWLVHPLNTESVTYVIQRFESLMGCLALVGLYALARSRRAKFAWPWLLASLLALLLGARTKEAMIAVPVMYVWYDRVFLSSSWRELLRRRGWYYVCVTTMWLSFYGALFFQVASAAGLKIAATPVAPGTSTAEAPAAENLGIVAGLTPLRYLASQPGVILHYLRLAVWPDRLCVDYVWPLPSSAWQVVLPGVVIVIGVSITVWLTWFRPAWGFLMGWFWINLAPRSSLLPRSDLAVEHRMYLPLAALVVAATLIVYKLLRTVQERSPAANRIGKFVGWSAGLVVIVALGIRTHLRNDDYQTPQELWSATLAVSPHNPRAMSNLGLALFDIGRTDEAIQWYRRAIQQESLLQYDQFALFNLGNALVHQQRFSEAIQAFENTLSIAPKFAAAQNNLAYVCLELGQLELARQHARRAVDLDSKFAGARLNLGIAARRLGQLAEAEMQLQLSVTLDPESAAAQHQLGLLLADLGKPQAAQRCFEKALELDDKRCQSYVALADLLRGLGRFASAVGPRQSALALRPHDSTLPIELARDLAASGKHAEARDLLRQTIVRDPANIEAWLVLGDVWAAAGDWPTAIGQYRQAKSTFAADERPYLKLAVALEAMRDVDAARLELEGAMAVAPRSEAVIRQLAEFWLRRREPAKAIESCERGIAVHPDSCHLLTIYGVALETDGDIRRAASAYSQAIAKNPGFTTARIHLAACLMAEGRLAEAVTQYDEALRFDSRNISVHNNLANLLARMGQPAQAIAHYEQALAIDPQFGLARANLIRVREFLKRQ